jgi:hypothetical protein
MTAFVGGSDLGDIYDCYEVAGGSEWGRNFWCRISQIIVEEVPLRAIPQLANDLSLFW